MDEVTVKKHHMTNSHIMVQEYTYLEPNSLKKALQYLQEYGDQAKILAGGTHLLIQMKMEHVAPDYLININKLPELTGFSEEEGALQIGSRTTIEAVMRNAYVQRKYFALSEASLAFGSRQIQIMGTIGGNICNGSPASDTVPALLVLDAYLNISSPTEQRRVSLESFLLGPGKVDLKENEILTKVVLPQLPKASGSAFIKMTRVKADLAKASVAAVIMRDGNRINSCRIALGSVAPTVIRARMAEKHLCGNTFSPELCLEAGEIAAQDASPIDDTRSTAWYRREVIKAMTHDALLLAWRRSNHSLPDTTQTQNAATAVEASAEGDNLIVQPNEKHRIKLVINGEKRSLRVAPNELLINVLRNRLELTGTKYGCGIGECGACTVHMNGRPALACLVLAITTDGSGISTIESLQGLNGELDPLQEGFIQHNAFQCGFCTPGMIMMSKDLIDHYPHPSEEDIRDQLKGNRCRCTGFVSIMNAIMSTIDET